MIELLLTLAMVPIALPAVSLLILTLAALGSRQSQSSDVVDSGSTPVRTAVLVPAHNESANVLPTIESVKVQLGPHDLLLLIADNCDDDTAELARSAGATVIERNNSQLRGKGYALAFGVDHLRADPPDVVLV
ncbi:MAG: glycosyltransferase family 2 protein, partial [Comamonadaceae bacterium]